jgi:hypothetical protein
LREEFQKREEKRERGSEERDGERKRRFTVLWGKFV